jgi:hypothetical protein
MHTIIMVNNLTNELVHIVLFMFQLFDHLTSTLYLFTGLLLSKYDDHRKKEIVIGTTSSGISYQRNIQLLL